MTLVFRGNSPAKLDAQGRIKVPSAHRKILEVKYGTELYVTSVTGQNALIYPLEVWEEIETKLMEPPRLRPEKLKFLRNTSYYGQATSLDKQGRVVIQSILREAASIEGEVAVIGSLNYLEIWNQEKFAERLDSDPYTDNDAIALAELGI